jgi:uncharacterized membrane protein (UPF0127 family)
MFTVEIADTDALRARGLMFRQRLPEDRGMLFDFKTAREAAMWMKNTYISLDMLFIRTDGTIAYIAENTVPQSLEVIGVREPVLAVLELAGGTARKLGIRTGDVVYHRIFNRPDGRNASLARSGHYRIRAGSTANRGVAQSGSAPALGAGGRQFESDLPDQPLSDPREITMAVRIYKPARNAMQSGKGKSVYWVLEHRGRRTAHGRPADGLDLLRRYPPAGEAALRHQGTRHRLCEREGHAYTVMPEAPVTNRPQRKSYSDNFKFGRTDNWTH